MKYKATIYHILYKRTKDILRKGAIDKNVYFLNRRDKIHLFINRLKRIK